jgi:hypothetical protein
MIAASGLRPYLLTMFTALLSCLSMWYDSSEMKYDAGVENSGRTTGAWFIIGFPITIGMAIVSSLPFSWLARRTKPIVGWLLAAVVLGSLLAYTIVSSSPEAKLESALRVDVPPGTRIEILRETSSFGDGGSYSGVISAEPDFVERLKEVHAMKPSPLDLLEDLLPAGMNLEQPSGFFGSGLMCYFDSAQARLYFRRPFQSSRR